MTPVITQPNHRAPLDACASPAARLAPLPMAPASFSRQFGARLVSERRRCRRPLWVLASRSKGTFTIRDLRDAEAGLLPLESDTVARLASLYELRLTDVLSSTPDGLEIREGAVSADGVEVAFRPDDPRSLVDAYFRLVRRMRDIDDDRIAVPVRSDDLRSIVEHLRDRHPPRDDRATSEVLEQVLAMAVTESRVVVGAIFAGAVALELVDCWTGDADTPRDIGRTHVDRSSTDRSSTDLQGVLKNPSDGAAGLK